MATAAAAPIGRRRQASSARPGEAAISAAMSNARKAARMSGGGRLTALDNETQRIILVPAAPRLTPRR
jgi:hypothetical protein